MMWMRSTSNGDEHFRILLFEPGPSRQAGSVSSCLRNQAVQFPHFSASFLVVFVVFE